MENRGQEVIHFLASRPYVIGHRINHTLNHETSEGTKYFLLLQLGFYYSLPSENPANSLPPYGFNTFSVSSIIFSFSLVR